MTTGLVENHFFDHIPPDICFDETMARCMNIFAVTHHGIDFGSVTRIFADFGPVALDGVATRCLVAPVLVPLPVGNIPPISGAPIPGVLCRA